MADRREDAGDVSKSLAGTAAGLLDGRFARYFGALWAVFAVPVMFKLLAANCTVPHLLYPLGAATIIAFVLAVLVRLPRHPWPAWCVIATGFLLGLPHVIHLALYRHEITPVVFASLFETFPSEAGEFVQANATFSLVTAMLVYAASVLLAPRASVRIAHRLAAFAPPRTRLILLCVFVTGALVTSRHWGSSSILSLCQQYWLYRAERIQFVNEFKNLPSANDLDVVKPVLDQHTLVLVIGESTARGRMSLYGYGRQTTPELDALQNALIVFRNTVSPHSHTLASLRKALTLRTFANDDQPLPFNANILQLAKLLGYETHWISNQPPLGGSATPVTMIARHAEHAVWLNDGIGRPGRSEHDNIVLPPVRKALTAGDAKLKLIVVHLMGTHVDYRARYPAEFRQFTDAPVSELKLTPAQAAVSNAYDDAVRYNDHILGSLIHELDQSAGVSKTLVYFSDHGEEVLETRPYWGHNEALQSNVMFEVPFLIWTSAGNPLGASWREASAPHSQRINSLEDFIHTFHDLLGGRTRLYEPRRSLLSPEFVERPVQVGSQPYQPGAKACAYQRTRNNIDFPDKLWVHRVDSLERYRELVQKGYSNFEVDVVFDETKGVFDVGHPPVASIGLSFEDYLKAFPAQTHRFWLDLKNLGSTNFMPALALLIVLDAHYQLKSRVIVESPNAAELRQFAREGFMTSLYLPTLSAEDMKNPDACTRYACEVAKVLNDEPRMVNGQFSAVSQNAAMLPVLEERFPDCDKLVWGFEEADLRKPVLRQLLNHPRVKVVLVKIPTAGYR